MYALCVSLWLGVLSRGDSDACGIAVVLVCSVLCWWLCVLCVSVVLVCYVLFDCEYGVVLYCDCEHACCYGDSCICCVIVGMACTVLLCILCVGVLWFWLLYVLVYSGCCMRCVIAVRVRVALLRVWCALCVLVLVCNVPLRF